MAKQSTLKSSALAAAIALALAGQQSVSAATITVNTLSDSAFVLGCTLRRAVSAANNNMSQAGCPAGDAGVADVIEFDASLVGGTVTLSQGQIGIESSVTIDGAGSLRRGITVTGNNNSGIFAVSNGGGSAQVTLRALVLRDGYVENADGAAVRNFADELVVDNCTLTGNSARFGLASAGGRGGALFTAFGETTVVASTITQNSTNRSGGGLSVASGTLALMDSTISDNSSINGGGIHMYSPGAALTVSGGTVSENTAQSSGGGLVVFGPATVDGVTFSSNVADSDGGAIFAGGGLLTVSNATLDGNTSSADGGGLFQLNNAETVISNSTIINNQASDNGGGLSTDGITTLVDVVIQNNTVTSTGGGIVTRNDGDLSMTGGSLTGNTADRGGGLMHYGSADLNQVSISNNTATLRGGGIYGVGTWQLRRSTVADNTAVTNGAAVFALGSGTASLEGSTISNNTSVFTGSPPFQAAIYAFSPLNIINSTVLNNAPNGITKANGVDVWNMTNTIIAGSAEADCVDAVTPMNQNGNNLIADGSCAAGAVDLIIGPPMLGLLGDNGGPTQTHQPLSGSPVVDAGTNVDCPDPDQTGMPRPIDGNADGSVDCDIGSVEFVDVFAPLSTLTAANDVTSPGGTTYPLTVTYTDVDGEMDLLSIGVSDITVLPGPLPVLSTVLSGTASQLSVTYTVQPPGGFWDVADSGTYTVSLNADEVRDVAVTGANIAAAEEIGQFQVAIGEIQISGNSVAISDGDVSPNGADGTDLGEVPVGNTQVQTFVISNLGLGTINLTAPVEVLGQDFSVSQPLDTELSANESTQFQLSFSPQAVGTASAVITVLNSDADENPYSFSVQAQAIPITEVIFSDSFEE